MLYATIMSRYANDKLGTTDLDVHLLWMQTKHDASLDFFFISNANAFFTRMQMRNVYMMHMSSFRDANFMMQMSHARVQKQSLSMMVPAHIFNRDANVSLQRCRCKNLVVQMPSNGYVMMQMLLVGMSWCKCLLGACHDANVSLVHAMMQMSAWEYAYVANVPL